MNASAPVRAWVVRALVVGLLVFHVGLFASHVSTGRLADSGLAPRWVLGVAVFVALLQIRRLSAERSGRRIGIVLWLLVALLHANAVTADESVIGAAIDSSEAVGELVAGVAAASLAGLGLLLLAAPRRSSAIGTPPAPRRWAGTRRALLSPSRGFVVLLSPRPPPLR